MGKVMKHIRKLKKEREKKGSLLRHSKFEKKNIHTEKEKHTGKIIYLRGNENI